MDLEKHPQKPVAPAEPHAGIRASDADRDRIADILREALALGRLDAEEHSERIDAVYRAKTMGELEPLVKDLPATSTTARPAAAHIYGPDSETGPAESMVAIFSSSTRKGRWRVGRRTNAFALFGSIEIDLTEAIFAQRTTVINATAIFGSIEVRVPENVSLRGGGTGVFGNFEVSTLEGTDAEAPVVVVNGYSVFGSIEAKPKRGKFIADLNRRLRKHLGH
ncbi:DUF1707 domain-containing protein [Streptomyces sp. NPDC058595]|uniref:DUF1707 SHOCT-like domain-containing protein n=1 Tax=Streptomyces sp. NPDC058595 TaxID=3346550 RepID=UPI003652E041